MAECLQCKKLTTNPKFCNKSCSAKFNNANRKGCINKDGIKICKCVTCNTDTTVNIRHDKRKVKCEICKGKCKFCKKQAKFKLLNGNLCCNKSANQCPSVRQRNSDGLKEAYKIGRKICIFTDEHRTKSNINQIESAKNTSFGDDILRLSEQARKYIIEERGKQCEVCQISEWNGKPIVFEIDHIDGNRHNNCKQNLKILCPNCHSQTPTWRGRNSNNGARKHTESDIIVAFETHKNIHKTLLSLGMAAKGANYDTVRKILIKNQIPF